MASAAPHVKADSSSAGAGDDRHS